MSLAQGVASNLYTMDLRSRTTTRLSSRSTRSRHIAVPDYSGRHPKSCSDRTAAAASRSMSCQQPEAARKRISFGEGRYSTPVWSPKGDYIAFTKQNGGSFAIGVMHPDGSGERILTEGFSTTKGPTLGPERPLSDVLSRSRRPGRREDFYMTDVFRTRRIQRCRRRIMVPTSVPGARFSTKGEN